MGSTNRDREGVRRIHGAIFSASLAAGIGAAIYFRDWAAIGLAGFSTFALCSIVYTVVAQLFALPRLRWREFFADLIGFLTFS